MTVNGQGVEVKVRPNATLLEVLREQIGLKGTKKGCGTGECGACTVLLDGNPVNACLVLALKARGRHVVTIEGLAPEGEMDPLQEEFVKKGALQCGFCGPGMLISAKALLNRNASPSKEQIKEALAGNICRCTGYSKIIEAVQAAGERQVTSCICQGGEKG